MAKERVREIQTEVLPPGATAFERDERLIRFVANLMDTMFVIPGTKIRFGLDPIIGLLPGIGDSLDAVISAFLLTRSLRYGVPKIVIARMAFNILINTVGGALPVAGDAFSVWWKSNAMNYELLRKHAGGQRVSTKSDWLFVLAIIGALVLCMLAVSLGVIWLLAQIVHPARP